MSRGQARGLLPGIAVRGAPRRAGVPGAEAAWCHSPPAVTPALRRSWLSPAGVLLVVAAAGPVLAATVASPVAATVNGVAISEATVARALEERVPRISGHGSISEARRTVLRAQVLEDLIVEELIVQEARRLDVKVATPAVEAEMGKVRNRFGSRTEYAQALAKSRLSEDQVRSGIERYLLVKAMMDREVTAKVAVTSADLKAYYDEDPARFVVPEQRHLRQILVAVDPSASRAEWEAARARAADLVQRARRASSGDAFATLARRHSQHAASRDQGGDLGWIHRGQLDAEQEAAAFALPPGGISDPVRTLYGFAVYQVEARRPQRALAFEEVNVARLTDELQRAETDRRRSVWLAELRSRATVEVRSSEQ